MEQTEGGSGRGGVKGSLGTAVLGEIANLCSSQALYESHQSPDLRSKFESCKINLLRFAPERSSLMSGQQHTSVVQEKEKLWSR